MRNRMLAGLENLTDAVEGLAHLSGDVVEAYVDAALSSEKKEWQEAMSFAIVNTPLGLVGAPLLVAFVVTHQVLNFLEGI